MGTCRAACDTREQSRDTAGLAAAVQEMRAKLREFRTIVESPPFTFCLFVRGERGVRFLIVRMFSLRHEAKLPSAACSAALGS